MRAFQPEDLYLSASQLADLIHARALSPVEVVKALDARISKLNPKLLAYSHVDIKAALEDADAKEKLQAKEKSKRHGRLFGVPVAVKDDLGVKGMPSRHGSRATSDELCDYDDAVVERLRAEGAIILGKTYEPEFGHKGTTVNRYAKDDRPATANPWDHDRTAGGSSGGSAAAVAAGLAYAAVGSDIGGSVRIPASCCGLVGHKPTFGVIPRVPSGNAFSFWVTGPITRTVEDAALMMRALAKQHPGDRFNMPIPADEWDLTAEGKVPRVLWCPRPFGGPVDKEVLDALRGPLETAHREKAIVLTEAKEPLLSKEKTDELWDPYMAFTGVDLLGYAVVMSGSKSVKELLTEKRKLLTESFLAVAEAAAKVDLTQYLVAQAAITDFCEKQAVKFFADCDLIATPTLAVPPFNNALDLGPDRVSGEAIDPHLGWTHTWPFNLTGEPAASVPYGWTKGGLPVGLQLVGKRGQDGQVLRAAAAFERIAPWADRYAKLG